MSKESDRNPGLLEVEGAVENISKVFLPNQPSSDCGAASGSTGSHLLYLVDELRWGSRGQQLLSGTEVGMSNGESLAHGR